VHSTFITHQSRSLWFSQRSFLLAARSCQHCHNLDMQAQWPASGHLQPWTLPPGIKEEKWVETWRLRSAEVRSVAMRSDNNIGIDHTHSSTSQAVCETSSFTPVQACLGHFLKIIKFLLTLVHLGHYIDMQLTTAPPSSCISWGSFKMTDLSQALCDVFVGLSHLKCQRVASSLCVYEDVTGLSFAN
jgi:hypothetical protein